MAVVHMTEAELVNNIADVMRQVRQGNEIIIEQGNRPVAVIKPSKPAGRMISEVIADLKARGSTAVMDDDFARDIEEGSRPTGNHGIHPPGINPRFQRPDRRRATETHSRTDP